MSVIVANGLPIERCKFYSFDYSCCILHTTRCPCDDYNPEGQERITNPKTNYDILTHASLEDMASKIVSFRCPYKRCFPEGGENCKKCWLDWLKREMNINYGACDEDYYEGSEDG